METVLRTLLVYTFLLVVFRLSGKRTMAQMDTFDMVVLLIISESTQQALVGDDYSITTCFLVITTLVGSGIFLAWVKQRSPRAETLLDGHPVVIIDDGKLLRDRMDRLRVDEEDILEAAHLQNVAGLGDVRFAILERNGDISIIPKK